MQQAVSLNAPVRGALLMVLAGIGFAGLNVTTQYAGMIAGIPSTTVAFWQYAIAAALALPFIWRGGFAALRTDHLGLHVLRVVLSAGGVQLWVLALSAVPIWQAVALVMTSPFFVIAGAKLFLGERITAVRLGAAVAGFSGAVIILEPWSAGFTPMALLPVAAAALWAGASVITKYLTRDENPLSITLYLLLLLTPVNAAILVGSGLTLPLAAQWPVLLTAGILTAGSQYVLTRAYSVADATYLQPFDDLKLPLNILFGWVVFASAPGANFWPGAVLIVLASLTLVAQERAQASAQMQRLKAA
ncbi:DMT family transporter [Cucumibacter marinus]|uniref:DMT family transporter n=1 Tax=Cucumibacter marinus TaxID=1121252 RepID=UPI000429BF54|nr:DMT family transporter [Cucumibacter marinus]